MLRSRSCAYMHFTAVFFKDHHDSMATRKRFHRFTYTLHDISEITGRKVQTVRRHWKRGLFQAEDLRSVLLYASYSDSHARNLLRTAGR